MSESVARVVRVLNNNAVLVNRDGLELVLAARGIGFGKKTGDAVEVEAVQRKYVETATDKVEFLKALATVDPELTSAVGRAVEIATELIVDLNPSVYVVMADHLSFAVQRARQGQRIENRILNEIRATFPTEFAAAEIILAYVNSKLDVELAVDEAGYIALHLNAARTGSSVKKPLSEANELTGLLKHIKDGLDLGSISDSQLQELLSTLHRIIARVGKGTTRNNSALAQITRALPREMEVANTVMRVIAANHDAVIDPAEAGFFAVFLHGWRQG